jgi:hypothetical protein
MMTQLTLHADYDEWLTFDCLHPHGSSGAPDSRMRCAGTPGLSNTLVKMGAVHELNFTNFHIALVTINHFRSVALAAISNQNQSTGRHELAPWVGFKGFFFDYTCPDCPEPDGYWQERILHYGLIGAARIYYFNVFYGPTPACCACNPCSPSRARRLIKSVCGASECVYFKRATHKDDDAMSATMAELQTVVGCAASERQWLEDTASGWQDSFILSGMESGDRQLSRRAWRFTPQLPTAHGGSMDPKTLIMPPSSPNSTDVRLGPVEVSPRPAEQEREREQEQQEEEGARQRSRRHTDCQLSFSHGVVLDVMTTPQWDTVPTTPQTQGRQGGHTKHRHQQPTPTASPFGLWVVQPMGATMPSITCADGYTSLWPRGV